MIKRVIGVALVVLAVMLVLAPAAMADTDPAPAPQAQATPSEECAIGEICIQENQEDLPGEQASLDPAKDPPGATIRSLIMLSLLLAAFVAYLRWALGRSIIPH